MHTPSFAAQPTLCSRCMLTLRLYGVLHDNVVNRFQKRLGKKAGKCVGGCSLSLDLSRAFDTVDRVTLYQTLLEQGVPTEIVNAIQQLHQMSQYNFAVGEHRGATATSNGIKQGCVVAPTLWCFFTSNFLERLQQHRDAE